jgi:hypothetical protein
MEQNTIIVGIAVGVLILGLIFYIYTRYQISQNVKFFARYWGRIHPRAKQLELWDVLPVSGDEVLVFWTDTFGIKISAPGTVTRGGVMTWSYQSVDYNATRVAGTDDIIIKTEKESPYMMFLYDRKDNTPHNPDGNYT